MQTNMIGKEVEMVHAGDAKHGESGKVTSAYVGEDGENQRLRVVVELDNGELVDAPAYYFKVTSS